MLEQRLALSGKPAGARQQGRRLLAEQIANQRRWRELFRTALSPRSRRVTSS